MARFRTQTASRGDSAPDAVIIGAGHNGLVAANLLADVGWEVVVCEATAHTGGAVRSAEVTAPGYLSDLFSAFYPLSAASPVLRRLELGSYGLTWTHAPAVLAHVMPDDRTAVLYRDAAATAESLSRFHSGDGEAFLALVRQWERIGDTVVDALFRPFPPIIPTQRLVRQLGVAELLRMARMSVLPVRRFGEENFRGEGAPMLFARQRFARRPLARRCGQRAVRLAADHARFTARVFRCRSEALAGWRIRSSRG